MVKLMRKLYNKFILHIDQLILDATEDKSLYPLSIFGSYIVKIDEKRIQKAKERINNANKNK